MGDNKLLQSTVDNSEAVESLLPGISLYLEHILAKESLSVEAEWLRQGYVSLLKASDSETQETLKKRLQEYAIEATYDHEAYSKKSSKLGHVKEKKLINIRQFKVNQKRAFNAKKMDMSESNSVSTTDDETRTIGDDSFVEISRSDGDLLSNELAKVGRSTSAGRDSVNCGYLFSKGNDGLRRRWFVLEEHILRCYKRQNLQNLVYEVNLRDGQFSAIQGRIGRMFAIRLAAAKSAGGDTYLFASQKADVCASWLVKFGDVGVRLQDDILREVTMNNQNNNNRVTWSLQGSGGLTEQDLFRSDLLEALELIERNNKHILPKRSSYSFKDLDVLKKLKASIVSKKTESKLNRRKTWSAGSFPNNAAIVERFRKPVSEGDGLASELPINDPNKSLPELLTSSGIQKINKQESIDLYESLDTVDNQEPSEDVVSFAKSMPEGLNDQCDYTTVSSIPRGSIVAQSVPDLLILPDSSPEVTPKQAKELKPSVSLGRVVSMKASLMKNAIITGFKRKGRRSADRVVLDRDLTDIHGPLFRKRGNQWKQRWCVVMKETLYAFRDSSFENEDFRCSLQKCLALRCGELPGRAHTFRLVRRKGEEVLLAAGTREELERWMMVLQREMAKQRLSDDVDGRSPSLTAGSYLSVESNQDSSAAEDTATEPDKSECCETSDKDSSDDTSMTSLKIKPRGFNDQGYMYHLVCEDTWEHCWVEVVFGVLSIYSNESKKKVLLRDRIALCDVQEHKIDGERQHSIVLTRPGKDPIYLEVDTESEFLKWLKCFSSWKVKGKSEIAGDEARIEGDYEGTAQGDTTLTSKPSEGTPNTSDSDMAVDSTDVNTTIEAERPKIRRSMTDAFSQLTPKSRRRHKTTAGLIDVNNKASSSAATAVKSSYLYYKANSGLWVKYWSILESHTIFCYNSPEEAKTSFSVDVRGCEIRRTSRKTKNFTFEVFDRVSDKHYEFAGESTYVMYAWMRVLKIPAGIVAPPRTDEMSTNNVENDQQPDSMNNRLPTFQLVVENDSAQVKGIGDSVGGDTADHQRDSRPRQPVVTSPKRNKAQITSLDQVLKLLHEKRLQQELQQNKMQDSSKRARKRWQYAMLLVLRKTRANSTKQSETAVAKQSESVATAELDPKTAKVKYREISAKYDHILEDERLKMLRRETLLKKRRNSLILRQETLKKKLGRCQVCAKAPLKKRQSKLDAKNAEMASYSKSDEEEVRKHLETIKMELGDIKVDIDRNLDEQKKIGAELNEKRQNELHELRITMDMTPQVSKSSLSHRRQTSDTSLTVEHPSEPARKYSVPEGEKQKLKHSVSSPVANQIRNNKSKSLSTSRLYSSSNPSLLPRTRTYDNGAAGRPTVKSRSSQEVLSLALSQIEDFEAFVQDSCGSQGTDVGL